MHRLCKTRTRSELRSRAGLEIEVPNELIILDQATVWRYYRRGKVELLPILNEIQRTSIRKDSLKVREPGSAKAVWDLGKDEPVWIDARLLSSAGPRIPVSARVSLRPGSMSGETMVIRDADMLEDAVCEKFPELRKWGDAGKKKSRILDTKRYSIAMRPKVIAPSGKVENSVMIRHLGRRRKPL
jgi:hypothetical protein